MELAQYLELLKHPAVIALLVVLFLYLWYANSGVAAPVPENLPWIGRVKGEFLGRNRANIRAFNQTRTWLQDGYEKYSKHGKSYNIPDVSGRAETVIPKEKLAWLLNHSDDVSSVRAAHYEGLQGDYAFNDPHILGSVYHEHVVHRNLVRNLVAIIPEVQDELEEAIDDTWGKDTENYKDVKIVGNMMEVIARVSNRMFVGKPLCRNPEYTRVMGGFANAVVASTSLIPLFPTFLRPIVGPLVTIPNKYYWWQAMKFTVPMIEKRKQEILQKAQDPDFKYEPPNDYITWHIKQALSEGKTIEMDTNMISLYLMPINFAAIHTTVFSITSTLMDLLGSDPAKKYLEGIREEVERIFHECDGRWSKASLAKLYRTDSAIRESLRISGFMTRGIQRKVLAPEGITDPEGGFTIPQGGFVSTDIWSISHDPEIYPNPMEYDAFRFSRPVDEAEKRMAAGEKLSDKEVLELKQQGMVTTSETFLPFGHGKHACPGRFFVSHEMKMLIAHMVMNYEVDHLPSRPPVLWFGPSAIPDGKVAMRLKRRDGKN